jgi:hypothetical protein
VGYSGDYFDLASFVQWCIMTATSMIDNMIYAGANTVYVGPVLSKEVLGSLFQQIIQTSTGNVV